MKLLTRDKNLATPGVRVIARRRQRFLDLVNSTYVRLHDLPNLAEKIGNIEALGHAR